MLALVRAETLDTIFYADALIAVGAFLVIVPPEAKVRVFESEVVVTVVGILVLDERDARGLRHGV